MANVSSSNSQKANVPKLRFPEFTEEWKTERLSDFVERVTRKNVNNQTELPLTISSKDGLVDQITYFNKKVSSKDMSDYYLLKNGEFAYNKSYSVGYDFGSIKRLDKYPMGALSTLYICFKPIKYQSDFLKIYFDSLKWYKEIYIIAAEGARNHGLLNVPTEDFFDTRHILPTNEKEQSKIADFLTFLEQRIEKQRQLVEALKSYKRGALSVLFPKKGEHTPECRFAGFTKPLEHHKLGEILQTIPLKLFIKQPEQDGKFEIIQQGNEPIIGFANGEPCEDYKETVVFGDHTLSLYKPKKPFFVATDGVRIIKGKQYIDGNYLLALLEKYKPQSEGYKRYYSILSDCDCSVSESKTEQKQIGTYFKVLDDLISINQRKYDNLLLLKSSLLQQMFI